MANSESSQTISVSFLICSHVLNPDVFRAIDSCLSQTFPNIEVVIVANGPIADDIYHSILDYYDQDSRVRVFISILHGLTYNLSYGLSKCTAPYVARLDVDDLCLPERVEKQLLYLHSHPSIDILGTQYLISPDRGQTTLGLSRLPLKHSMVRFNLFFSNPICHPSVIFKKSLVAEVGGYTGAEFQEDYDLWVRLMIGGKATFANLSDPCIVYSASGIGDARGNARAYCGVASTQARAFLLTANPLWLLGFVFTLLKLFLIKLDFVLRLFLRYLYEYFK